MKKSTWKKLFTRNKSRNRELNTVVCSMCVGMPLADVTSLCDRHRNASEAPKSVGILKEPLLTAECGKESNKCDENHPSVSRNCRTVICREVVETFTPASALENEAVVEEATQAAAESNAETPLIPIDPLRLANKVPPSPSEDKDSVVKPGPESAKTPEDIAGNAVNPATQPAEAPDDSILTENPQQWPDKQDGAITNDEFMTEEVDSPSLSENSRTENTVPIVIEPPETPSKELVREDSQLKRRISFTSPTKVIEIPSKEEQKLAEKLAAAEEGVEQLTVDGPNKYLLLGMKKRKKRPTNAEKNAAITMANQTWFGTAQPGKSADEANSEEEDEEEDDDDEVECEEAGENGEKLDDVGKEEDEENSHSLPESPNPSQPTPQSDLRPNVFLKAPESLGNSGSTTQRDSQSVDGIGNIGSASSQPNSQDDNTANAYSDKSGNQDKDEKQVSTVPTKEHQESMTTTTLMNLTHSAAATSPTPSAQGSQVGHSTDRPISDTEDNSGIPGAVMTSPPSTDQIPHVDHTSARMVFGSIPVEFSNQPLLFSPNFGAQRIPNAHAFASQDVSGEEPQFPHYSIYGIMKNFMKATQSSEDDVGRVTEIIDFDQSGQEATQQQLGKDESEQSPPSLEIEEEFEQNPGARHIPEEQKE